MLSRRDGHRASGLKHPRMRKATAEHVNYLRPPYLYTFGARPIWARVRLGPGPIWDQGPFGPRARLDPGPGWGPGPVWAQVPFGPWARLCRVHLDQAVTYHWFSQGGPYDYWCSCHIGVRLDPSAFTWRDLKHSGSRLGLDWLMCRDPHPAFSNSGWIRRKYCPSRR